MRLAPLSRRAMLLRSAAFVAAAALPPVGFGQAAGRPRRVAVTIDDGPATGAGRDLEAYLRIGHALRESFVAEKIPAIMFINERQLHVDGQRDVRVGLVQQWLGAGLELGNHTYSHLNAGEVPLDRFLDDIVKGEIVSRSLLEARGRKLVWFRYPFLATGKADAPKAIEDFLAQRGYRIAPVTVDYRDYSFAGNYARHLRAGERQKADEVFATMLQTLDTAFARAEQRSIEVLGYELPQTLLIHCNEMNALTLRTALQRIRDRGYTFVSLDDAMEDAAYQTPGLRPGALGAGGLFNALAAAKRAAGG